MAALVAACAAMLATGLAVSADPARSGVGSGELTPDLEVQRPSELYLAEGGKEIRLRVSNTVANVGTGPLEIQGDGNTCATEDVDGRRTVQRIFEDDPGHAESLGFFVRDEDEAFSERQAGCSRFHPSHDHWHFDNFARYSLYNEGTGRRVGGSRKVSFCVIDTGRPFPGLDGSPEQSYYPQDPEHPQFPTCSAGSIDGLSVGWEDTYGASLPGQGIKVTKLRRGAYCLVLEADPASPALPNGVLDEVDEVDNNTLTARLRMRARKGVVNRLGPDCKSF
jgi:hypothetical protein